MLRQVIVCASLAGCAIGSLLGGVHKARGAEDFGTRTVSVAGTAVTSVRPDHVQWNVSLHETDPVLSNAKERVDAKAKIVLAIREELGVAPEDLETSPISIRREYYEDEEGRRTDEFKHYAVSRSFVIRQRDLARIDEFLAKLLERDDFTANFSFQSSEQLEARLDSWVEASKVAREKAQRMVEAHGAKLGRLLEIKEAGLEGNPYRGANLGTSNTVIAWTPNQALDVDAGGGTFAPGAIDLRVSVLAVFEIVDAE